MAASSTVTNSDNFAGSIPIKWQTELLKVAAGYLVADKFANTEVMAPATGDRVRLNKVLRPAKQTTASTAGTLIASTSAKSLTSNYMDLVMETWGDSFGFNEDVSIQSIIQDPKIKEVIANQMARSLDYQVIKRMSTEGLRIRNDGDTTLMKSFTVDGLSNGSGTPTTIQFSDVSAFTADSDDTWNGGFACFTAPGGPAYDECRQVDDNDQGNETIVMAAADAFTQAPTTDSSGIITVGTDIAATDVFTASNIATMAAHHEYLQTEKFEGGLIRCFLHSAQKADLWTDTGFTNSATYDDSGRFKNYSIIRWLDNEFMVSSEIYREDVDGTENQSTGIVYVAPFFGKNSYSVVRFGNTGAGSKFGVEFIPVFGADSQNLRKSAKWLSWKGNFAAGVTRATSCIGLMTGATDLGIIV